MPISLYGPDNDCRHLSASVDPVSAFGCTILLKKLNPDSVGNGLMFEFSTVPASEAGLGVIKLLDKSSLDFCPRGTLLLLVPQGFGACLKFSWGV